MKKNWFKAIAFCVIASYIFTISFGFSQSKYVLNKDGQAAIQSAVIDNKHEQDDANPHIEYFAAAINKLYNTIASVNKVINI